MFKPTKQYFKRNIMPFGGYSPNQFLGMFPSLYDIGSGNNISKAKAILEFTTDSPINYLVTEATLPEREMQHTVIYRHGRGSTIPTGTSSPLYWSASFLLDETFQALKYFLFIYSLYGGIENKIEYYPEGFNTLLEQIVNKITRKSVSDVLGYEDYNLKDLFNDTKTFGKCDITMFALPKTTLDYELDIPFVRPLNLSTFFLGRTFVLKNTIISKIGNIVFSNDAQNTIGRIQIDFISDYMIESTGVNPLANTEFSINKFLPKQSNTSINKY